MIQDYKNDIEKIHASEELINRTIKLAKQEEKKRKQSPAKIIKFTSAALVSAAAITVIVNLNLAGGSYTISRVDQIEVRSTAPSGLFNDSTESADIMTEDEFNDYIGLNCLALFETANYYRTDITADKGTFYYENDDSNITVSLSKDTDLTPESMKDLKTSKIDGHEVRLATDGNNYYAAENVNDISCYISAKCSSEKQFKKLIKEFQKNF